MSGGGYHDPQKATYVDEAVLGGNMLNWAFETVAPEESGPVMPPMPHHRMPLHRQQYTHHQGVPPPGPSGFVRQPSAHHHAPRPTHRQPVPYPPSASPVTSLPPPPPPPLRAPSHPAHAIPQGSFSSAVTTPGHSSSPSRAAPNVANQNSTCQYCGKSYSRPDYLSTHIAGKHSGRKMWNCKICGKEYKWRSSLSHHQKTAHQRPEGAHGPTSPRAQTKPPQSKREYHR